jgi:SAM-dependent methyltransferase
MIQSDTPLDVWERIASHYLSVVDSAPHNALYERPAMVQLVGDVTGVRALDAGCGSGYYLQWLLERGAARVIGVDGIAQMVQASLGRTLRRAEVLKADLDQPLEFLETGGVDLIVASLVLHYLEDWSVPLREFNRVLPMGGSVVLSVSHPLADFESSVSKNYFEVERILEKWSTFGVTMPSFRRSFGSMMASFRDAGFAITALVEPLPLPHMADLNPKSYDKLIKRPNFLCARLRKDCEIFV